MHIILQLSLARGLVAQISVTDVCAMKFKIRSMFHSSASAQVCELCTRYKDRLFAYLFKVR